MSASPRVIAACLLSLVGCNAAAAADGNGETLRGIVRAVREASISTDLFIRVNELPFREGESFKEGDILAAFDCSDLKAEHKAAKARQRGEQLTYDNNRRLAKLNAAGEYEVQLQLAKLEQAKAEVESLDVKIDRCHIRAPFNGRVADLQVNEYEFPDRERPLMRIVDPASLEIELLLPASWLQWLKPGEIFDLHIEETDITHRAEVTRILPVVDPVSQTIKVIGRFAASAPDVLPGMSGPAKFMVPDG